VGIRRKRIETLIGTFLNKNVPGLRRREKRGDGSIYEFPPLAKCRAAFERLIQQETDWPEQEDWRDKNAFWQASGQSASAPTMPPSER